MFWCLFGDGTVINGFQLWFTNVEYAMNTCGWMGLDAYKILKFIEHRFVVVVV